MHMLESTAGVDLRPRGENAGQEGVEMASSSTRQYSCGSQWEESTWILGCCGIVTSRRMRIHELALYSLPSVNVNPREWIKVNIYRGVNS